MASRQLKDMHPAVLPAYLEFEEEMKRCGIDFVRACTYRSPEEQNELYAQGRTKPGRKVTWVTGGGSKHNYQLDGEPASLAADYYPLINGKLANNKTKEELNQWYEMAKIAEELGISWGGRWKGGKVDFPHFEISDLDKFLKRKDSAK